MKVLYLGHAGFYIETDEASILCDPWFNPAYFGSWWPFPANDHVNRERIGHPTLLYISHLHQDHFDPDFLSRHVDKSVQVILPAYPLPALEDALRRLGFTRFLTAPDGEFIPVGKTLKVATRAYTAPADGPLGDSCLMVDDGTTRLLNLNDAHPRDFDALQQWGPIDGLCLQFSGAIWYPMVYELPPEEMAARGREKRRNEMERAATFIRLLNPRHIFPSAGPAGFLDPDLFAFNDVDNDETNTFPDQTVFLTELERRGLREGHLVLPGTEIILNGADCQTTHHFPGETPETIFEHKADYLRRYQAQAMPRITAERSSWPAPHAELLEELRRRLEPIMAIADLTARRIRASVVLDWGDGAAELDFRRRQVRAWDGKPAPYYFQVPGPLIQACLDDYVVDWVNSLFLSCRFRARREGEYNEAVYTFFKCLSPERIQYAEGYWMESEADKELWQYGGWLIQRRCPHLKADLRRFATIDQKGILTCQMHGWRFDLESGRCLNADDRVIYRRRLDAD
ncbi:MAG: Rieske 2Fe-2S domain-containing protein [Clostridia bacterium]